MNKNVKDQVSSASWMITFADLLSLLLTFFVLLFSTTTVKTETWQNVIDSMAREFNPKRNVTRISPEDSAEQLQRKHVVGLNLTYLEQSVKQKLSGFPVFEGVQVLNLKDRLVISFPANIFFERKDVALAGDADRNLKILTEILVQIRNGIQVAGHTDNVPISSGKFRSNWELSMGRAQIVAGSLTDYGYGMPITVLGYAHTREKFSYRNGLVNAERIDIIVKADETDKGSYDLF